MKTIVVVTAKGKTSSVTEYSSKKSAEAEVKAWGWRKMGLSRTTYAGTVRSEFGMPTDAIATFFTAKEWETMQYAY